MTIDDSARVIIANALVRLETLEKVSDFYGVSKYIIVKYLRGKDNGTVNGRKIMRIEMGRLEAVKKGNMGWVASKGDRYKGGREY